MPKNLPQKDQFIGKTIDQFPKHVIKEHIASGSNGHLFRAYDESTESSLAYKIISAENIQSEQYLSEARKANRLDHPSAVKYFEIVHHSFDEIECVVFVCDYVKGINLREYIKKEYQHIDIHFIEKFLMTIFGLFYELQKRGYQHGDLHAGNILVAKSDYDMTGQTTFRITDFGVGELTGQAAHGKDYLYIADVLRQLLQCVDYQDCNGRDRYVFDKLNQEFLGRHLVEADTTADPLASNPESLATKLTSLEDDYRQKVANNIPVASLVTPFDYPSCEQIGSAHLLLESLYSDRLLGLSEIQARSNLMLTGPRGCGKTTAFRALSLEYLTSTGKDNPTLNSIKYIGIYYRCDDLYFSFPRYKCPERTEALDIPMHFLVVTLLAIVLEQVEAWAIKYFEEEFNKKEKALVTELCKLFDWSLPNSPNAGQLVTLVNKLKGKERQRAVRKQRRSHITTEAIEGYFGPGLMVEACRIIRNTYSFLRNLPFYFFIDDYSHPKITKELQANLNRLLMHRNPDIFFKMSTESPVSFARQDVDGKQFVESREYDLLNLGLRYITSSPDHILAFLKDLFERRFKEVTEYPIQTLEELLGSIPRNENETARTFREGAEAEFGKDNNYAGCETIAAMCSGDIHYMIRLVAKMVDDFGGKDALTRIGEIPRIPARKQHASIRDAAGNFMDSVRTLPGLGPKLVDVATAFGNVAHSYLMYKNSTNITSEPPHQASRIEPYEALYLSEEAQEILDELLRYSIFIQDPRGMSRRGKVVPRFYLRRYLIPHFRLTFSKRDSLALENRQIQTLLGEPKRFEDLMRLKSKEDASRRDQKNSKQSDMFNNE